MNTDCINEKDLIFNDYISSVLVGVNDTFEEPFMSLDPRRWSYVKGLKEKMRFLRNVGKQKILERIKYYAEQNTSAKDIEANDILSAILKNYGRK